MGGGDDFIGSVETSLSELKTLPKNMPIMGKNKKSKKKEKQFGELTVVQCKETTMPSFVDYMQSSLDMSLIIAIDYTLSNKDPSSPSSLHYIGYNGEPSKYQTAIRYALYMLSD